MANGHKAIFEDDGTLRFDKNARVWQDIDFPIIIRQTGPNIPVMTEIKDGITAPQWSVNDTNQCEGQELVHLWAEGSEGEFHCHMITNGLDTSDRFVKMEVKWFWANVHDQLSATQTVSYEFTIPANTPDKTHLIIPITTWSPEDGLIGAHVYAKLTRITSTGSAPSNNPWISMLQFHVLCDTLGSRSMTSK